MPGPIAGQGSSAPSVMDMLSQGGAGGPSNSAGPAPADVIAKIRALKQQADDLGQQLPSLGPELQELQALFRRMVVKAAQGAPTQGPSAQALPTGG